MESRYGALRTISTIYNILGVIVLVLTVLGIVISVGGGLAVSRNTYSYGAGLGLVGGLGSALSILVAGGLTSLGLFGISQLIYLLIDMEENTRQAARMQQMAAQNSADTNRLLRDIGGLLYRQQPPNTGNSER